LARQFVAHGIDPLVLLVGADGRAGHRPHPLPTQARLQDWVLVSVSVRRAGLYVSLTRQCAFRPLTASERVDYQRVSQLAAELFGLSAPHTPLSRLFDHAVERLAAWGIDDGFPRHHLGGVSGYAPREIFLRPQEHRPLAAGQVVAYNPAIGPWKSEDTALVTASGARLLTVGQRWPQLEFSGADGPSISRPDILVCVP
jgi:Xaa-Pro dipeptidase